MPAAPPPQPAWDEALDEDTAAGQQQGDGEPGGGEREMRHGSPRSTSTLNVKPIAYRKSPDGDDMGYKAVLESLTNPQSYMNFRSALRTVVIVSFPLFTLGTSPNTMFDVGFICMIIAAVLSTSWCRPTLGEQIGILSWVYRGILYMYVIGESALHMNAVHHPHHWWGLIAAGIFVASFTSDANIRRFMYLYFFVYMMEMREWVFFLAVLPSSNCRWLTANLLIGSGLSIAATLFPYPVLLSGLVDIIAGRLFTAVGKGIRLMHKMVWSDDVYTASLFYKDKSAFDVLEYWMGLLPTLLWFVNWEPLEFTLRNPIRRLKLSFLRRIMSLVYAAFNVGATLTRLKREQKDRIALQKVRQTMLAQAFGVKLSSEELMEDVAAKSKFHELLAAEYGEEQANLLYGQILTLTDNSHSHSEALAEEIEKQIVGIITAPCTPEGVLKMVDFEQIRKVDKEMRRNLRMHILHVMHCQREVIMKRRKEIESKQQQSGGRAIYSSDGSKQGDALEFVMQYQRVIDDTEIFIQLNIILFHMLLSMLAGEVYSFGEQMKDYRPEKPIMTRLLEHFIIEPWYDFWEEVWFHLTLARPTDWRILKDAIKMTSAYLSACALNFEMYVIPGGQYYFGTTILLGLPVEEESLSLAVNRLAGNAIGCSLGFIAFNNFDEVLHKIIPMAMFFIFLCQLFKNHPVFGQTFFYSSLMVMGGVATSYVPLNLLTRLIASSYTILAYLLCCLLIFPTNPIKILWGYRVKLSKLISEIIDQATLTVMCSMDTVSEDADAEHLAVNQYPENEASNALIIMGNSGRMCAQLSSQIMLARRILTTCNKWTPFAARQHVIRGMLQFPANASLQIHQVQLRLLAELDLLVFGAQLLHRPRKGRAASKPLERLITGSLTDFLLEFSHTCRLVQQDFIDSLQLSREWDYENYLSLCGRLSRLKVAAHAVMYECYVLLAVESSYKEGGISEEDFSQLRQNMRDAQGSSGMIHTSPQISVAEQVLRERVEMEMGSSTHRSPTGKLNFTAPLTQFAMNPHAASLFQTKDNEERHTDREIERAFATVPHEPSGTMSSQRGSINPLEESHRPPSSAKATWLNFSYHEDAMDLPSDTDFVAIIAILGSCEGFIGEIECGCASVNTISSYQKQLHESSLALPIIEKLSNTMKKHVESVYLSRHYNLPIDDLNSKEASAISVHTDSWRAWAF